MVLRRVSLLTAKHVCTAAKAPRRSVAPLELQRLRNYFVVTRNSIPVVVRSSVYSGATLNENLQSAKNRDRSIFFCMEGKIFHKELVVGV